MHGHEILNMTLKRILDHVGYVLIVARGDGKVLVLGTDNARNRLISINAASPLEHFVTAIRTDHYADIVRALKRRFAALAEDGFGLWFHVDPRELRAAIDEFDLATGQRVRDGQYAVNGRAWVKDLGGGTIAAITERGCRVRLDRPRGAVREVIAPRSLMKPYLRAVA